MLAEKVVDYFLDRSGSARRIYGLILLFRNGFTDSSKWFLFNREKLKFDIKLKPGGIVLDIGAFKGDYTAKMRIRNRNAIFWLYEPVPEYFRMCVNRFTGDELITVRNAAVSGDGRDFSMEVAGLRSRQVNGALTESLKISSVGIQEIFDSSHEFELLKMNIEGMEFECLDKLIGTKSLIKAKYLLIQFHDFENDAKTKYDQIQQEIVKDFEKVWCYNWMWELWLRKKN